MIQKSDGIILFVASACLTFGVIRWQEKTNGFVALDNLASRIASAISSDAVADSSEDNTQMDADIQLVDANAAQMELSDLLPTESDPTTLPITVTDAPQAPLIEMPAAFQETDISAAAVTEATPADLLAADQPEVVYWEHIVTLGDSLYKLADRFGVDVETLQSLNNIENLTITEGQSLIYPADKE